VNHGQPYAYVRHEPRFRPEIDSRPAACYRPRRTPRRRLLRQPPPSPASSPAISTHIVANLAQTLEKPAVAGGNAPAVIKADAYGLRRRTGGAGALGRRLQDVCSSPPSMKREPRAKRCHRLELYVLDGCLSKLRR